MTRTARWIECTTKGCDARYTGWCDSDAEFIQSAEHAGWVVSPNQCPDCASQGSVDPSIDRIMVIPLTHGAFTAYAPETMTAEEWALVSNICKATAQAMAPNGVKFGKILPAYHEG